MIGRYGLSCGSSVFFFMTGEFMGNSDCNFLVKFSIKISVNVDFPTHDCPVIAITG